MKRQDQKEFTTIWMIKSTWYDRRWILSLQTKIRTRPYDDNLSLHVSLYVCKTMFRLCKNWNKSPDLVLYLITLKWSYANNLQVFQHLNIHIWVYNRLSPYNLLRLICFISPKRSSESVFFFSVCVYCDGISLYDGVMAFSSTFLRFSSCISFAVSFWVIFF